MSQQSSYRVNKKIRISSVLVIDDNGDKKGIMATRDALRLAMDKGLDLVEISPNSRPPVCKILDYGKFKYDEKRRMKERKANQVKTITKEVKFRPKIATNDLSVKIDKVIKFLQEGNKCKLEIMFKGRERAHPNLGRELLLHVSEQVKDIGTLIQMPISEGSKMTMILGPKKNKPGVS